ncbi:MAG: ComF family protein [Gammaproteobacteria bacterium]|nr:ComF family protein [Gammaproteobacteria bacterium]
MVYHSLLQFLLSGRCAACGSGSATGLCTGCRADLAPVERPCAHCGLPMPVSTCPRQGSTWVLDAVIAPLEYVEPLDDYVQALKFAGRRHLGRALGELLVEAVRTSPASWNVEAIVPVPLHRRRFLERGYNQAVEIARPVAAALRIDLCIAGIRRQRATAAQAQLGANERRANLRRAFSVTRDLKGRRVAIVDDVITTGATINSLAHELLLAGASSVQAWAVARSI